MIAKRPKAIALLKRIQVTIGRDIKKIEHLGKTRLLQPTAVRALSLYAQTLTSIAAAQDKRDAELTKTVNKLSDVKLKQELMLEMEKERLVKEAARRGVESRGAAMEEADESDN